MVARGAALTGVTKRVVEAVEAATSDVITAVLVPGVDVVVALAW